MYPKENVEPYNYLLSSKAMEFDSLREVLNNTSYTCFSDVHKGSNTALHESCPLAEDRRCMHHILKNIPAVGQVCPSLLAMFVKCRNSSRTLYNFPILNSIQNMKFSSKRVKRALVDGYFQRGLQYCGQTHFRCLPSGSPVIFIMGMSLFLILPFTGRNDDSVRCI